MKKLIYLFITVAIFGFTSSSKIQTVIDKAMWQTTQSVTYDGSYRQISYPNGDVPANIGVCTDVIIRAYRAIDVDLQKLVHEDILSDTGAYNLKKVDSNIDHRRCSVLRKFFKRQGAKQSITKNGKDYLPGDLVFWDVAAGHVGIVVGTKVPGTDHYYVVHNIGSGPKMEDILFNFTIVDHYRWNP